MQHGFLKPWITVEFWSGEILAELLSGLTRSEQQPLRTSTNRILAKSNFFARIKTKEWKELDVIIGAGPKTCP